MELLMVLQRFRHEHKAESEGRPRQFESASTEDDITGAKIAAVTSAR